MKDIQPDGTVTQSPYQLWNYETPRCNAHENLAWTPDGAVVTCFWSTDRMNWQNVQTGTAGFILNSTLGLPTNTRFEPVWLPDGDLMAFGEAPGCVGTGQWLVHMNGLVPDGPAQLLGAACPSERRHDVVLSSDGSTIAYVTSGDNSSNSRIALADPDGTNERLLRPISEESGFFQDLAWSPDGAYVLASQNVILNGVMHTGISSIAVDTGDAHWVLPPQAGFDARYPASANVADATPTEVRPRAQARVSAVNGNASVTAAVSGDTLTITGTGFSASNPPATLTICDTSGAVCLVLPVEQISIDSAGNLTCTVVVPSTWTPGSSSGGSTTGTPGGDLSTGGLTFPSGPSTSPVTPASRLFVSPNHGQAAAVVTVGVDYLRPLQAIYIAGYASHDASGAALPGSVPAQADPCGCMTTPFTVPAGTQSIAAFDAITGAIIAYAPWTPDDQAAPVVVGTPDRAADGADGWYREPVVITWTVTDADTPASSVSVPPPTAAGVEGAGVSYTSDPACDSAGNCATGQLVISLDVTEPVIDVVASSPTASGWYTSPASVAFVCSDALSGVAACPQPVVVSSDGAGQFVSGTATDVAGNASSASLSVNIDSAPPAVSAPELSTTKVAEGGSVTVLSTVFDTTSGVVAAEAWVGPDPGVGNGTMLNVSAGEASGALSGLSTGIHEVAVRAIDGAGNWSISTTATLVVYDPTGSLAAGAGWIVPGGASSQPGDQLPGLNGSRKLTFGFLLGYTSPQATTPTGLLTLNYSVGGFRLTASTYEWLVAEDYGWARFRGEGHVNGSNARYTVLVDAFDSGTRDVPGRLIVRVYAPGADPATAQPMFQASGNICGGVIAIRG